MASGHEQSEWSTFNRIDNERHTRTFSNKINTHAYITMQRKRKEIDLNFINLRSINSICEAFVLKLRNSMSH